jgi:hypothetical protein
MNLTVNATRSHDLKYTINKFSWHIVMEQIAHELNADYCGLSAIQGGCQFFFN